MIEDLAMNTIWRMALLGGVLAAAACTNADRFGPGGAGAGGGFGTGGTPSVTESALDPSSPAYFEEEVGDRVHFAVDQSTLSASARATLDGQVRWLQRNPAYTAIIEGHADEQGTREYNLALGARRAASARDYLVSQGIASGRLRTVTYGKERPIAVCSTEACYAQNRRAVTVIAAGQTS